MGQPGYDRFSSHNGTSLAYRVTGAEGVARKGAKHGHARALATVFGDVTVRRIACRAPGPASLHPADAALNLPEEKYSHGLRKLAAIEAAGGELAAPALLLGARVSDGHG
jgi:hypothetical protein